MELSKSKGEWALVTGASSGIGEEFCQRLAANGMNLLMVARRGPLLETLAEKLRNRHGILTLVLPIDLGERGSAMKVREFADAHGIRVKLLINNAAYGPWGSFDKTSAEAYEHIVQLIAATPIALCHLFQADLSSHSGSAVINLSSPAALQPVPYKAVYSAVKACLHNFSLALYGEWSEKGILVQTLLPGPTDTDLDKIGGAYKSKLGEERRPASEIVDLSIASLTKDLPFVTTNKGTYKQRLFAGIAPVKMIIREVKKMFAAPAGR